MIETGLDITFDDVLNFLGRAKELTRHNVLVGIPDSTAGRSDGPASNAVIGYIQEHGSPKLNIPARPFLRPGAEAIHDYAVEQLKKAAIAGLEGKRDHWRSELEKLGIKAVSSVRSKIVNGNFVPLSPRTLAARKARGVSRTKPLIDTGRLLQSITYVIRRKGGGGSESSYNG